MVEVGGSHLPMWDCTVSNMTMGLSVLELRMFGKDGSDDRRRPPLVRVAYANRQWETVKPTLKRKQRKKLEEGPAPEASETALADDAGPEEGQEEVLAEADAEVAPGQFASVPGDEQVERDMRHVMAKTWSVPALVASADAPALMGPLVPIQKTVKKKRKPREWEWAGESRAHCSWHLLDGPQLRPPSRPVTPSETTNARWPEGYSGTLAEWHGAITVDLHRTDENGYLERLGGVTVSVEEVRELCAGSESGLSKPTWYTVFSITRGVRTHKYQGRPQSAETTASVPLGELLLQWDGRGCPFTFP